MSLHDQLRKQGLVEPRVWPWQREWQIHSIFVVQCSQSARVLNGLYTISLRMRIPHNLKSTLCWSVLLLLMLPSLYVAVAVAVLVVATVAVVAVLLLWLLLLSGLIDVTKVAHLPCVLSFLSFLAFL